MNQCLRVCTFHRPWLSLISVSYNLSGINVKEDHGWRKRSFENESKRMNPTSLVIVCEAVCITKWRQRRKHVKKGAKCVNEVETKERRVWGRPKKWSKKRSLDKKVLTCKVYVSKKRAVGVIWEVVIGKSTHFANASLAAASFLASRACFSMYLSMRSFHGPPAAATPCPPPARDPMMKVREVG